VDETVDHMLCLEIEEDRNIREFEGGEGTNYEDADSDTGW
jgi:hypothetical protein